VLLSPCGSKLQVHELRNGTLNRSGLCQCLSLAHCAILVNVFRVLRPRVILRFAENGEPLRGRKDDFRLIPLAGRREAEKLPIVSMTLPNEVFQGRIRKLFFPCGEDFNLSHLKPVPYRLVNFILSAECNPLDVIRLTEHPEYSLRFAQCKDSLSPPGEQLWHRHEENATARV